MASGIYQIINTVNGKRYIGSAVDLKSRFGSHKRDLKKFKHRNMHLQNAWHKYGESSFKFEVITECEELDLIKNEQFFIDSYDFITLYNISPTAHSLLGFKPTQKQKEAQREARNSKRGERENIKGFTIIRGVYTARITDNGKMAYLGFFKDEESARKEYFKGAERIKAGESIDDIIASCRKIKNRELPENIIYNKNAYSVCFKIRQKMRYIGRFKTIEDSIAVRDIVKERINNGLPIDDLISEYHLKKENGLPENVALVKREGKYQVSISYGGKRHYIGRYKTVEEAVKARDNAYVEYKNKAEGILAEAV